MLQMCEFETDNSKNLVHSVQDDERHGDIYSRGLRIVTK